MGEGTDVETWEYMRVLQYTNSEGIRTFQYLSLIDGVERSDAGFEIHPGDMSQVLELWEIKTFNKFGQDGWELAAALPHGRDEVLFYFKRRIEE